MTIQKLRRPVKSEFGGEFASASACHGVAAQQRRGRRMHRLAPPAYQAQNNLKLSFLCKYGLKYGNTPTLRPIWEAKRRDTRNPPVRLPIEKKPDVKRRLPNPALRPRRRRETKSNRFILDMREYELLHSSHH